MKNLTITERKIGSVMILDLKGNIRLGEGNIELHRTLRFLVHNGERNIVLNLAEVDYVDSSGLGELIAGYSTLKKNGGALKLLNLTKRVRELMIITKLLTVFYVYRDESEAINSFQPFFKSTENNETAAVASTSV